MAKVMLDEDSEIVTSSIVKIVSKEQTKWSQLSLKELDPEIEIEIHEGDQPVYPVPDLSRIMHDKILTSSAHRS